ncbi:LPS-assembly lipoprotein LptE [Sulfuriferula plumbiphila]|uniref:LPS-assembly lipoprotein LptE n=1 Tax=Sulfuriferula plumbiphila TaxID=171865 RepID=A0A512L887_9PROT|nr:LPS assembly lipoprotein LptE [Sulfuriferula plumbiphila]BBP05607.1 LPS-assembly lipoprotein LptE [Sulfuriferula plumbiphila]GEP30686.1 LPS-assembly lipoprotein LptE [Sulfuriferula plumbiphila]
MKNILTHWLWLALIGVTLTAGCGFHLRGQVELPYRSVYVEGGQGGLTTALQAALRLGHAGRLAPSAAKAESVIQILSEQNSKVILSLSGIGRVREYQLQYRVQYQLITPKGKVILAPANLLLARDMTYNDAQVLAKGEEEQLLYRDMQKDAAQQILRRIASAH